MKFLFIIQGEGRGHLTQALALSEILGKNNHQVLGAFISLGNGDVPSFFTEKFQSQTFCFKSPSLVYCKKTKALDIRKTLINSIFRLKTYYLSLRKIQATVKQLNPDIIINFYDVLGGLHQFLFRPKAPMVCIAHQYLLLNPNFKHPQKKWFDKFLVNTNTRITALGATKKLALSFTPFENYLQENIYTIPPLLRPEILDTKPETENFILVYVTQYSLAEDLVRWHEKNQEIEVHCFWDKPQNIEVYEHSTNLYFHRINGQKFLEMMQKCRGLVSTAGFESVCEAMYLGKPTMMIPVPKHYEQACNALDAKRAGAGIIRNTFDLTAFLDYIPHYQDISADFQLWHSRGTLIFLREIESIFCVQENFSFELSLN